MIVVNSDKKEFRLFAGTGGGIYRGILLNHRCIGGVKIDKFWQSVLLYRQEDGWMENLLLHHGEHRVLYRLKGDGPKFYPKTALEEMGFEPNGDYFLGFDIMDLIPVPEIDPYAYQLERKGKQSTTPYFTTIDKIKI